MFACLLVAVASEFDAPIDTRKHVGFLHLQDLCIEVNSEVKRGENGVTSSNQCTRPRPIAKVAYVGSKTTLAHHEPS